MYNKETLTLIFNDKSTKSHYFQLILYKFVKNCYDFNHEVERYKIIMDIKHTKYY